MSSTTNSPGRGTTRQRRGQDGQILVLFAGGLIAFLAVAALVFDVGQDLFDWRAQRDAADAAALAGARYVAGCGSLSQCPAAVQAALGVAKLNGYGDGATNSCPAAVSGSGERVCVSVPPTQGLYAGWKEYVEVDIHTDRQSFFAAVLGALQQNVTALAVAGNSQGGAPPYSLLALNPDCTPNPSGQASGNGTVDAQGTVFVNSNCAGALLANGNGTLIAPECDVVGTADAAGNGQLKCDNLYQGVGAIQDPLQGLKPPPVPAYPPHAVGVLLWSSGGPVTQAIPTGCPGSTAIEVVRNGLTNPSTAFASGASVALPYFNPGDLAIVMAYRNNSDTPPTRPGGWTTIVSGNGGGTGNSGIVGYRFLQNGDTSTGTWANATAIQVIILRGADPNPIGAKAFGTSTSTTMTTPGLTLQVADQTSWVVAFAGSKGTDANTVNLAEATGSLPENGKWSGPVGSLALHTGQGVSAWSLQAYSPNVNAAGNWTAAVEILADKPSTATSANPVGCTFTGGSSGSYNIYRLYPGVYYGGIKLNGTVRVYMAPGTYWLAGGGLQIGGNGAQLISDSGGSGFSWPTNPPQPGQPFPATNPFPSPPVGVLIYNTEDKDSTGNSLCGIAPGNPCIGPIKANGGSDTGCGPNETTYWRTSQYPSLNPTLKCAWVHLVPNSTPYKNLLIFQDRNLKVSGGQDVFFNGTTGIIELFGTIYVPAGDVFVGGDAYDTVAAQIIAYTFDVNGSPGTNLTVTYNSDALFQLKGVGLVE